MADGTQVRNLINRQLGSLPTLPEVVTNIMAIVRDERSTTAKLAAYIERDQAISAGVLRVANSAYYGSYRKVDSIGRAIVVLGFEQVRAIALGTGVFKHMGRSSSRGFDRRRFWLHSIGVATAAKLIARRRGHRDESFFVAGILHDLGKLVLDTYQPQEYAKLIGRSQAERRPLWEFERERFGLDHAEAGRLLLERWKLPDNIISALRHHHAWEGNGLVSEVAKVVALADNVCLEAGIGASGSATTGLEYLLGVQLGFTDGDLRELTEELKGSEERIEGFLQAME